jgi:hypothetical protein
LDDPTDNTTAHNATPMVLRLDFMRASRFNLWTDCL